MKSVSLILIFALFISFSGTEVSAAWKEFTRQVNSTVTWKYMINIGFSTYAQGKRMCKSVNGELAMPQTEDDIDFAIKVLQEGGSPVASQMTWLGWKKDGNSCDKYDDGSKVDFSLYNSDFNCNRCTDSCCAVILVWTGQITPYKCDGATSPVICIVKK